MCWLLLSLTSGISVAIRNIIIRALVFRTNRRVILYSKYIFVSLFAMTLISVTGVPEIKPVFYTYAFIASVIDVIAAWFYLNAIASAQLAKTFPLIAFTPIFAIGTSFVILGERPSLIGLSGILLIVCGAYFLRVESIKTSLLEPIKLLFKEKGPRQMLIAAFLFSFLAVFFKKAILNSSPFFAFGVTQLLSTLILTLFFLVKRTLRDTLKKTKDNFRLLFIAGIIAFLAGMTLFAAFQLGFAAYVVSVKRISIVFTVILGYIFFKEDHIARSLIISSIMLLGILLISLG